MRALGFEANKDALPLRRYVLEKNDIGLSDFIKGTISPTDWQDYQDAGAGAVHP